MAKNPYIGDRFTKAAKEEGYAARSVFKLREIASRHRILLPGERVLDLGCAPGSWTQLAAERVGPRGGVLGVDLQGVNVPLPPWAKVVQGDVFDLDLEQIQEHTGEGTGRFHGLLSDMAPQTIGIRSADQAASASLAERAIYLATQVLRPGGWLVVKVFESGEVHPLRESMRKVFARIATERPEASRQRSIEVFLVGMGFRIGEGG